MRKDLHFALLNVTVLGLVALLIGMSKPLSVPALVCVFVLVVMIVYFIAVSLESTKTK